MLFQILLLIIPSGQPLGVERGTRSAFLRDFEAADGQNEGS